MRPERPPNHPLSGLAAAQEQRDWPPTGPRIIVGYNNQGGTNMSGIGRRGFIAGTAGLAFAGGTRLFGPSAARAQGAGETYPNRPVRFIVPLAAGGGLDFIARLTADHLSRHMGQQFFVENRTGGGGTIGHDAAVKSAPDGYSVLVTNDNVASSPHILRLNVDFVKDLVPVILLARQPQALAVHPSLNVSSVAELIEAVKKEPGMGYASSGVGSNQHVLGESFVQLAGIKMEHVPYRGAGQAINDLIAGHIRIAFLGPTALLPNHAAGKVRIIAQSAPKRSSTLADIPTLVEAGFPSLNLDSWYAVFVPVGTPPAIVARLNAEMDKAMADPTARDTLVKSATEPHGGPPEQAAAVVKEYAEKYAQLAKELNLKIN
jgi:tripartite-type tricarboxylate transporter receptor subunit TctC